MHVHKAVVDRSIGRSCVSESRGKRVSNFPIGAMGTFELSGADGTYSILVDLEAAPIIKDENRNGHVN